MAVDIGISVEGVELCVAARIAQFSDGSGTAVVGDKAPRYVARSRKFNQKHLSHSI